MRRNCVVGLCLCVVVGLSLFSGYVIGQGASPSFSDYYLDQSVAPYSYMICTDGAGWYWAVNGSNGAVCLTSTNASYLWNTVIQTLNNTGGGKIVQNGNHTLTSQIMMNMTRHISIEAQIGSWFIGSILPMMTITGNGMDGWDGVDYDTSEAASGSSMNDVTLDNLHFLYNGVVSDGSVIDISYIQNDNMYQGAMNFNNMIIMSNQTATPTNTNFVGLRLVDVIGLNFNYLSIKEFGTGVSFPQLGTWQGSHNVYNNAHISHVSVAINYTYSNFTCETWNRLKMMYFTTYGFYVYQAGGPIILISPQCENYPGATGIYLYNSYPLIIKGGVFSTGLVGIHLRNYANAELTGNRFMSLTTGIIVDTSSALLIGNSYATTTTKVQYWIPNSNITSINDNFVTDNSLSSANTTATTCVINHGLAAAANGVWVSFNDTAITGYTWTSTATQVTITATGTLPASWTCYIKAQLFI